MESKLPNDANTVERLRARIIKGSPKPEPPSSDRADEIVKAFCARGELCVGCRAAHPALFSINVLIGLSGRVCRICSERELNDIIYTLNPIALPQLREASGQFNFG
jgi:hypothetical protein